MFHDDLKKAACDVSHKFSHTHTHTQSKNLLVNNEEKESK